MLFTVTPPRRPGRDNVRPESSSTNPAAQLKQSHGEQISHYTLLDCAVQQGDYQGHFVCFRHNTSRSSTRGDEPPHNLVPRTVTLNYILVFESLIRKQNKTKTNLSLNNSKGISLLFLDPLGWRGLENPNDYCLLLFLVCALSRVFLIRKFFHNNLLNKSNWIKLFLQKKSLKYLWSCLMS